MEEDYKFDLRFCKSHIKAWKRWYMRKNSKYCSSIYLRCHHAGPQIFWKYYLELSINRKITEQYLIMPVVYDTFDYDPKLVRTKHTGVEFITILDFTPVQKIKIK